MIAGPGMLAPVGDPDAAEFWATLDRGRVLVAACGACGRRWLPPLGTCPRCGSHEVTTPPASPVGRLYSWSVIHLAVDPVFAAETPYVVGLVELGGGARLYGRVVGVEHDDLRDGLELALGVTRVGEQAIWRFEPVGGRGA